MYFDYRIFRPYCRFIHGWLMYKVRFLKHIFYDGSRIFTRIRVDASVLQWGQIKTRKLYNPLTETCFVYFCTQRKYKICVDIDPCYALVMELSGQCGHFLFALVLLTTYLIMTETMLLWQNGPTSDQLSNRICWSKSLVSFFIFFLVALCFS